MHWHSGFDVIRITWWWWWPQNDPEPQKQAEQKEGGPRFCIDQRRRWQLQRSQIILVFMLNSNLPYFTPDPLLVFEEWSRHELQWKKKLKIVVFVCILIKIKPIHYLHSFHLGLLAYSVKLCSPHKKFYSKIQFYTMKGTHPFCSSHSFFTNQSGQSWAQMKERDITRTC